MIEDDNLEPLPPGRRQRTSGTCKKRDSSSPAVGGKQVQERVVSANGGQSGVILSSEASGVLGGTPVQRRVTSSLGRRSRDKISSEASRDSAPRDKRSRTETAQAAEVPSSPPNMSRGASSPSLNSGEMSGVPEKRASRKYWKKEYVPERNWVVFELAKKFLQAEVLAQQPWPNTATIENLVRRSWDHAWQDGEEARRKVYPGAGRSSNEVSLTKEPDMVSLEMVSGI